MKMYFCVNGFLVTKGTCAWCCCLFIFDLYLFCLIVECFVLQKATEWLVLCENGTVQCNSFSPKHLLCTWIYCAINRLKENNIVGKICPLFNLIEFGAPSFLYQLLVFSDLNDVCEKPTIFKEYFWQSFFRSNYHFWSCVTLVTSYWKSYWKMFQIKIKGICTVTLAHPL